MSLAGVSPFVFVPALLLAFVDWFAVARQDRRMEYFFKPATMLAVIAAVWLASLSPDRPWRLPAFFVGFVLSLIGDVLLMLPSDKYFVPGLVAFLLGHVGFIVGLNPSLPPVAALVLLIPIAAASGFLSARIIGALRKSRQTALIAPVSLYALIISVMLWSAWATLFRAEWTPSARVAVIAGATLFFLSDAILAWNRFVQPLSWGRTVNISTYHLGQIALALSLLF